MEYRSEFDVLKIRRAEDIETVAAPSLSGEYYVAALGDRRRGVIARSEKAFRVAARRLIFDGCGDTTVKFGPMIVEVVAPDERAVKEITEQYAGALAVRRSQIQRDGAERYYRQFGELPRGYDRADEQEYSGMTFSIKSRDGRIVMWAAWVGDGEETEAYGVQPTYSASIGRRSIARKTYPQFSSTMHIGDNRECVLREFDAHSSAVREPLFYFNAVREQRGILDVAFAEYDELVSKKRRAEYVARDKEEKDREAAERIAERDALIATFGPPRRAP